MLAKILAMIGWAALKEIFSGWLSRWRQKKEVEDAVEPYKKELEIKNRPIGKFDDTIDGL